MGGVRPGKVLQHTGQKCPVCGGEMVRWFSWGTTFGVEVKPPEDQVGTLVPTGRRRVITERYGEEFCKECGFSWRSFEKKLLQEKKEELRRMGFDCSCFAGALEVKKDGHQTTVGLEIFNDATFTWYSKPCKWIAKRLTIEHREDKGRLFRAICPECKKTEKTAK